MFHRSLRLAVSTVLALSLPGSIGAQEAGHIKVSRGTVQIERAGPGSGIRMSMPIAAGRPSATFPTIRASQVRGHGHWPYRRRLSSSIATITTGPTRRTRGTRLW